MGFIQGSPDAGPGWALRDPWVFNCKVDKIDDSRLCNVYRGDLSVFRTATGYVVRVGDEHYPGTNVSL